MKKKKLYLHTYIEKANHAGRKAVVDCETILQARGYKEISIELGAPNKSFFKKIVLLVKLIAKFISVPNDSILIIEHPIYTNLNYFNIIKLLKKFKNINPVFIIHDLECIRNYHQDRFLYSKRDYIMFSLASRIICHNDCMAKYLVENGVDRKKIIVLGIFDYILNDPIFEKKSYYKHHFNKVVIAGNLNPKKSEYIYKLLSVDRNFELKLYGPNFKHDNKYLNYKYEGQYTPEELPSAIDGDFGLVWDGNQLETCSGTGDYLRYNNPHKMSLYIICGLPIIVWNHAALAAFVKSKNLGILVDSLYELNEKLTELTIEDYIEMKKNVMIESEKIKKGYYLNKALSEIECSID